MSEREIDNPRELLNFASPERIIASCRWWDTRRGSGAGPGVLAKRIREGGMDPQAANRPRLNGRSEWEEAKQSIQRAIQRHGRDGRAAALSELAEQNELLVRFVEKVRWSSLCGQEWRYVDRDYAELWAELVQQAEPAA